MLQSTLNAFVILSLICSCTCIHVPFDLNGWKAVQLDNKKVLDSMILSAEHLQGALKEPVTAFKWDETIPDWDLYRVSFQGGFQQGKDFECHADAVWITNPSNVTVFNTGCIEVSSNPTQY
ncbi:insoluble matrix shell protein 2-like [Mercenaria mercenaria]|uniref:insoluble matrix shell protein 2-like n=1 Tax=Mercenaria mercenaria TaxID=6596 RepID=UPI00234F065B|nr:insoluble matrix shell protein 2-like [Mercenaria mercenaria]